MIYIAFVATDNRSIFAFEQISVLLTAQGITNTVQAYQSAPDALERIPGERPDLVFIDLRMSTPPHTALDIVRSLRQHPLCKKSVIVGIAEYASPSDRTAALGAGCTTFLPKPLHYQDIEELIQIQILQPSLH